MSDEGGGHGVGLWYVSFSDMITLLLAFFVMMVTFSSYDKEGRDKFGGVVQSIARNSIFTFAELHNSLVPSVKGQLDRTEQGSEVPPADYQLEATVNPQKLPLVAGTDAYRDLKAFYVPSRRLFWGQGTRISQEGQATLGRIAEFIQKVPCQVVLAEISDEADPNIRLERAWAVQEYLCRQERLPAEWISISASPLSARSTGSQQAGEALLEISLLGRELSK